MGELLAHLVGDYLLQSHWMATEKTKRNRAAVIHAVLYTVPFLFLTRDLIALAVICGSHFLIDRFRLARYVVALKNMLAPAEHRAWIRRTWSRRFWPRHPAVGISWPTSFKPTDTGYPDETPPWLSVWLLIIADNTLHLLINHVVLSIR